MAVIALLTICAAMWYASRRRRDLAMRMVREQVDVATVSVTALGQVEVVKAAGAEDHVSTRWTAAHNRFLTASQQLGQRTVGLDVMPAFLITSANAAVTIVGLIGVTGGRLSLGGFVAVQTLLGLALSPPPWWSHSSSRQSCCPGSSTRSTTCWPRRCRPSRWSARMPRAHADRRRPAPGRRHVRLRHQPTPLLSGLNLHIAPGARVALVGPSGCGKSTVARLVVGLYEPWSGDVLIDGYPRAWWPPRVLHHDLSVVDQDPVIFAGTFRENITLWDPTISDADVVQAAKDAMLHDEIARRPGPTRRSCARAAATCPAVSASAWRSPGRWCAIRP